MKYLNLIILLLFLLACQDKKKDEIKHLVSEWQGKEIRFPKDMVFARFATDTVDFTLPKSPHKVLVFVDSIGCTSCKLQLHRWKELIQYTDSITQGTVPFLFFFQSDDKRNTVSIEKRQFRQTYLSGSIRQAERTKSFPGRWEISNLPIG